MIDGVKLVLIDVDNTLLDFNKNSCLALKESFLDDGIEFEEEYFKVFKTVNDKLWQDVEKKIITRDRLHAIRFNIIFSKLGFNLDADSFEKRFLQHLDDCTIYVDGAMDLVKYLSNKYVLCSASNAPYNQQIKRLAKSNIKPYLKHLFISQEIGYSKPDVRFFEKCLEKAKYYKKEETIMIGDSISADILGGKNYGIKTVWFNFENKAPSSKVQPDFIVNKLEEIKNIL